MYRGQHHIYYYHYELHTVSLDRVSSDGFTDVYHWTVVSTFLLIIISYKLL